MIKAPTPHEPNRRARKIRPLNTGFNTLKGAQGAAIKIYPVTNHSIPPKPIPPRTIYTAFAVICLYLDLLNNVIITRMTVKIVKVIGALRSIKPKINNIQFTVFMPAISPLKKIS